MSALEIRAAKPTCYPSLYKVHDEYGKHYATVGAIHTNEMTVSVVTIEYRTAPRAFLRTVYGGQFWEGFVRHRTPFTKRSLVIYAGKFARQVHKTVMHDGKANRMVDKG